MTLWCCKKSNFYYKTELAPASTGERKSIYSGDFEQRSLLCFILSFFPNQSPKLPTLDMILAELKQPDFPVMSKSPLRIFFSLQLH